MYIFENPYQPEIIIHIKAKSGFLVVFSPWLRIVDIITTISI